MGYEPKEVGGKRFISKNDGEEIAYENPKREKVVKIRLYSHALGGPRCVHHISQKGERTNSVKNNKNHLNLVRKGDRREG